jgi:hypothetical protein
MNPIYCIKLKPYFCFKKQVIRARAKEAVKRAKDGLESGFSSQGYGQAAPIDDIGDPRINRRKPLVHLIFR